MGHIIALNNNRLPSVKKNTHRVERQLSASGKEVKTVSVLCLQIRRVKRETLDTFAATLGRHASSIMHNV